MNKWVDFKYSNPKTYNPNSFIFLVHGIQLGSPASINGNPLDRKHGIGYKMIREIKHNSGSKEPDFDLVENPHDIAKMTLIDCSLIGRGEYKGRLFEQLATWAPVGLILDFPAENILISGKEDLGTDCVDPKGEIKRHIHDDKGEPWDLLLNGTGRYNHVAVVGKSKSIKIVGVFYNEWQLKDSPQIIKDFDKEWANVISKNANVPLITISASRESSRNTQHEIN